MALPLNLAVWPSADLELGVHRLFGYVRLFGFATELGDWFNYGNLNFVQ